MIQTLSAENEDLSTTISTLNSELITSNDEAERLSAELDTLRNRSLEDSAYESSLRERDVAELERVRLEKDEWERAAQEERVVSEELRVQVEKMKRQLEIEGEEREAQVREVIREKKTSANLQSVLEDFQAGECFISSPNDLVHLPNSMILNREGPRNSPSSRRTRKPTTECYQFTGRV